MSKDRIDIHEKAVVSIICLVGLISVVATIDIDNLFGGSRVCHSDNTPVENPITDAGETLGRVFFNDTHW